MRDHSRVVRLGARAAGTSEETLQHRLERAVTVVSVDIALPGALLTLRVMLSTLRRMPGVLILDPRGIPPKVADDLMAEVWGIDRKRGMSLRQGPIEETVHLHIGARADDPRAIRTVPDGYGAHLARDPGVAIAIQRRAHPLGSVFAASLGVAEAFKDLAGVVDRRRVDHRYLTWCPVALSHDLALAPMQSRPLDVDLALAGCGAIGTAIAVILEELDAEGDVLLIDRQRFARENVATYSIGDERNARGRPWKVNLVGQHLNQYRVRQFRGDVEAIPNAVDEHAIHWPSTVLGALDSPEARRALQLLWPDRLIDGGTSDTAVALHDVRAESGPCLKCFFPEPRQDNTVAMMAELTGLSTDFLGQGDVQLEEQHIAHLPGRQRELMRPHVGRLVCGLARALGLVSSDPAGYAPAIPFVAQQAACLVVGRLLADHLGMTGLPNFVEYDVLIGPSPKSIDHRRAEVSCYSERERARVERVRQYRSSIGALGPRHRGRGISWPVVTAFPKTGFR